MESEMAQKGRSASVDPEVAAMSAVVNAIQGLDVAAQQRVIGYAIQRFKLDALAVKNEETRDSEQHDREPERRTEPEQAKDATKAQEADGLEGIETI
jgi:hypothetical protein